MPRNKEFTNEETITYQLVAREQKHWNKDEGRWDAVPPYTAPSPVWGVAIRDGRGQTTDPHKALEFADMGYTVTPDPHIAVQEIALAKIKREVEKGKAEESDLDQLQEYADEWRAQHAA